MRQSKRGAKEGSRISRLRSRRRASFLALCAAVLGVVSLTATSSAGALSLSNLLGGSGGTDTTGAGDQLQNTPLLGNSPTLPGPGGTTGGGAGGSGTTTSDNPLDPGDLPINPEWLANTLERATQTTSVKNNTSQEALQRRDDAVAAWKNAVANGQNPNPLAKPEYSVVWSSKQNAGDINSDYIGKFLNNPAVNPQGLSDLLNPQFLPGLDGFQVIDERKLNVDGSDNPDYGKVVNFVQLPLPWGVEAEAHHMQYQWEDGEPIIAGGLFNDTTFVLGADDIPNLKLENIIAPQDTLQGTIPDAYDAVGDGKFIGTYMGGPEANFGGSPGSVDVIKPDPQKGLVLDSETPAGAVGGVFSGNANGVPEPCTLREGRPLGTCANPHGIQIRQDLNRMVTADYAEPREIVLDPVKTIDKYAFRPTVRTWDTSDPSHPKLVSVAHMPDGPLQPAQRAHEQYGIMEDAKTWPSDPKYPSMTPPRGSSRGRCAGAASSSPPMSPSCRVTPAISSSRSGTTGCRSLHRIRTCKSRADAPEARGTRCHATTRRCSVQSRVVTLARTTISTRVRARCSTTSTSGP